MNIIRKIAFIKKQADMISQVVKNGRKTVLFEVIF